MYYTHVHNNIYFPNSPRNIRITIIFTDAPNIKCYHLPLTNTRPLSGKSNPESLTRPSRHPSPSRWDGGRAGGFCFPLWFSHDGPTCLENVKKRPSAASPTPHSYRLMPYIFPYVGFSFSRAHGTFQTCCQDETARAGGGGHPGKRKDPACCAAIEILDGFYWRPFMFFSSRL